jgi:hypothetical protein
MFLLAMATYGGVTQIGSFGLFSVTHGGQGKYRPVSHYIGGFE